MLRLPPVSSARRFEVFAASCCLFWGAAFVYNTPLSYLVWDDAFMFVRYADRLLSSYAIAWNPGDLPTWGPTSLGFLLVVTPLRLLFDDAERAALASSFFAGGALVALLVGMVWRISTSLGVRLFTLAVLLAVLSRCGNSLAAHFRSGMDTTFAMAYLTAYLTAAHRLAQARPDGAPPSCWSTGLLGGLALVARPDLTVYVLLVPAALATSRAAPVRRAGLRALLVTVLFGGAVWAACALYFGSPLPLSFYVKSPGFYDAAFERRYASLSALHLRLYLESTLPLALLIALGVLTRGRLAWRARIELGVGLATCVFIAYYRYRAVPVMHYAQRFYYPSLPALLYLAFVASARLGAALPEVWRRLPQRRLGQAAWAYVGAALLGLAALGELLPNAPRARRAAFRPTPAATARRARIRSVWPGLDAMSRLPDDLLIATTEVGIPGALNPQKRVLDTSGLNTTTIARGRLTPAQAIFAEKPDVVYLHPDYTAMNREFRLDPRFDERYVAAPPSGPGQLSVFLRRDSRYRPRLDRAVAEDLPP